MNILPKYRARVWWRAAWQIVRAATAKNTPASNGPEQNHRKRGWNTSIWTTAALFHTIRPGQQFTTYDLSGTYFAATGAFHRPENTHRFDPSVAAWKRWLDVQIDSTFRQENWSLVLGMVYTDRGHSRFTYWENSLILYCIVFLYEHEKNVLNQTAHFPTNH